MDFDFDVSIKIRCVFRRSYDFSGRVFNRRIRDPVGRESLQVILWYPLMDPEQVAGLYQQAASLGLPLLVAEFQVTCETETALEKSGVPGPSPVGQGGKEFHDYNGNDRN